MEVLGTWCVGLMRQWARAYAPLSLCGVQVWKGGFRAHPPSAGIRVSWVWHVGRTQQTVSSSVAREDAAHAACALDALVSSARWWKRLCAWVVP